MKIITQIPFSIKNLVATVLLLLVGQVAVGQTINALPYSKTDNFDAYNPTSALTATSTIPTGWSYSTFTGVTYRGRTAAPGTNGGYYAFGSSSDFSLGTLRTSSDVYTYAVSFTNSSGSTITSITLSWDYEQWRFANNSGINLTGTGALASNATLNAKDFTGTATGTVGTTTSIASFTLTGLSIANGQAFGLSFSSTDASGADNAISIDNFSIQASGAAAAVPDVTGGTVTGTVGTALTNYQISATNSPTSYAIATGSLPAGLSLNTTSGIISGTPTAAGTSVVTVTAANGAGTSTPAAVLNFDIAKANQTITFAALANKQYGDANFNLTGTTTSGLTLTYESSNPSVATVLGNVVTVVGVGSTNITASQAGDANYNPATNVVRSLTVTAKSITIEGLTGNNKIYDATTTASVSGTATLTGVLVADTANVSLTGTPSYTFASATIGTAKPITVSGYGLTGSAASNYTLATVTGVSANITAKTITVTGVTAQDRAYNGTTVATVSGGTLNGVEATDVSNVSVSTTGIFASANVGTGIGVTISLTGSASTNYSLTQPGITANITKANQTITFNALPALNTGSAAVNLNTYASTTSGLALTYTSSNPLVVSVSGNTLTVVGVGTATITASQAGDSNYNVATNATQNVTVSLVPVVLYSHNFNDSPSANPYTTSPLATTPAGVLNANISSSQWVSSTGTFTNFAGSSGSALVIQPASGVTSTMTLNMTIATGYKFTLTDFSFWGRRTSTGPNVSSITVNGITVSSSISISTGGAAVPSTAVSNPVENLMGNISVVLNLTAPTGSSQNLRLDDFTLKGYITQITEVTWENGSWSNTTGPTASLDAIIKGVYNTQTNGVFTAKKLTLTSGSFTIKTGTNITVIGDVINSLTAADFVVENNANLLQGGTTNNNSGNITVKRESAAIKRLDYTLWSAPVTGQGLYAFSKFTLPNRFYVYDSSNDTYSNSVGFNLENLQYPSPLVVPNGVNGNDVANVPFVTGNGYLIRVPYNHPTTATPYVGTFTGIPNTGTITISSLTSGLYYAIGNPYPSTIDADTFIGDNGIGDTLAPGDGLYFWRKTNNAASSSYATYTTAGGVASGGDTSAVPIVPNGVIQVGEGFIVRATSTSIAFNNDQRIANNDNQFLRTNLVERNRIWLNLTDAETNVNQMMVSYMTGATQDIDAGIDGRFFNDTPTALNSLVNNEEFAIQGRSLPFEATDIVPLAFKAETEGNYSISIDHVDGLFTDGAQAIYLKDNLTTTTHDLNTGAYSFATAAGTFNNRFEIVYQPQLANPIFTGNAVVIYSQNNGFVVNSGNFVMASIKVFDIRGRLIEEKKAINANETTIKGGLSNGVLLVQITTQDGVTVTKKVIR